MGAVGPLLELENDDVTCSSNKTLKCAKMLACALDSTEIDDLFGVDGSAASLNISCGHPYGF